jgi:hypothetical protein
VEYRLVMNVLSCRSCGKGRDIITTTSTVLCIGYDVRDIGHGVNAHVNERDIGTAL